MEQLTTIEVLDVAAQVLQTVAILAAACFAWEGLGAWKDELKGKREFELAEEIISSIYEVRDVFLEARNPGGFGNEGRQRTKDDKESDIDPEVKTTLDGLFVPVERLQRHSDLFARIQSLRYPAMALKGAGVDVPFAEIQRGRNLIINASASLIQHHKDAVAGKVRLQMPPDLVEEWEKIIWSLDLEDDFQRRIDDAISKIENAFSPYLKRLP